MTVPNDVKNISKYTNMPKYAVTVALPCILLLAVFCSSCSRRSDSDKRMKVAASIAPLADFCTRVGGDYVDVTCLVPPGINPHVFDLTPDKLVAATEADVFVMNGAGLEFWAGKVQDAAGNKNRHTVVTSTGIHLIQSDHDHGELGNPHVWLNPIFASRAVEQIRDAFIQADPTHTEQYKERAAAFLDSLATLDKWIADVAARWTRRSFISFHSSWVYFANRYGLTQASVIEEQPGQEISPSALADITQQVRSKGINVLIAEPQFSRKSLDLLAGETGASVVVLDALGGRQGLGYLEMMHQNVLLLDGVLR